MRRSSSSAGARFGAIVAGLVLLAAASRPASAHDLSLIPERATPDAGATIRVALHVSEVFPGEPIDWRPEKTREFFQLDGKGRIDLDGHKASGQPLMPSLTVRSPGSTVVALATEPSYIETAAPAFRDYLKAEGHDDVLEMRTKLRQEKSPGRERYRHWVKTLVNVGGEASVVALKNLNLTIEIVPEAQPAAVLPGGRLPVRVLFEGAPYAGGRLCATHAGFSTKPDTYAWCGPLDGAGRASVPILAPGWQLLRITRMRALAGDGRADWVSYWASLTFEVPEAGPSPAPAARRESP
jgi:Domain of unknown function (DUF4198)